VRFERAYEIETIVDLVFLIARIIFN
jgi:hypothetical protein